MDEVKNLLSVIGDLKSLVKFIDEFKSQNADQVNSEIALKEIVLKASSIISNYKAANRVAYTALEKITKKVQSASLDADARQLSLQNLLYEKGHLLREIDACRSFKTPEFNKINFVDLSALREEHPELVSSDPHELQLNRLYDELERRRALESRLEEKKRELASLRSIINSKQAALSSFPQELHALHALLEPLQQRLGVVRPDETLTSQLNALPLPLQSLHRRIEELTGLTANPSAEFAPSFPIVSCPLDDTEVPTVQFPAHSPRRYFIPASRALKYFEKFHLSIPSEDQELSDSTIGRSVVIPIRQETYELFRNSSLDWSSESCDFIYSQTVLEKINSGSSDGAGSRFASDSLSPVPTHLRAISVPASALFRSLPTGLLLACGFSSESSSSGSNSLLGSAVVITTMPFAGLLGLSFSQLGYSRVQAKLLSVLEGVSSRPGPQAALNAVSTAPTTTSSTTTTTTTTTASTTNSTASDIGRVSIGSGSASNTSNPPLPAGSTSGSPAPPLPVTKRIIHAPQAPLLHGLDTTQGPAMGWRAISSLFFDAVTHGLLESQDASSFALQLYSSDESVAPLDRGRKRVRASSPVSSKSEDSVEAEATTPGGSDEEDESADSTAFRLSPSFIFGLPSIIRAAAPTPAPAGSANLSSPLKKGTPSTPSNSTANTSSTIASTTATATTTTATSNNNNVGSVIIQDWIQHLAHPTDDMNNTDAFAPLRELRLRMYLWSCRRSQIVSFGAVQAASAPVQFTQNTIPFPSAVLSGLTPSLPGHSSVLANRLNNGVGLWTPATAALAAALHGSLQPILQQAIASAVATADFSASLSLASTASSPPSSSNSNPANSSNSNPSNAEVLVRQLQAQLDKVIQAHAGAVYFKKLASALLQLSSAPAAALVRAGGLPLMRSRLIAPSSDADVDVNGEVKLWQQNNALASTASMLRELHRHVPAALVSVSESSDPLILSTFFSVPPTQGHSSSLGLKVLIARYAVLIKRGAAATMPSTPQALLVVAVLVLSDATFSHFHFPRTTETAGRSVLLLPLGIHPTSAPVASLAATKIPPVASARSQAVKLIQGLDLPLAGLPRSLFSPEGEKGMPSNLAQTAMALEAASLLLARARLLSCPSVASLAHEIPNFLWLVRLALPVFFSAPVAIPARVLAGDPSQPNVWRTQSLGSISTGAVGGNQNTTTANDSNLPSLLASWDAVPPTHHNSEGWAPRASLALARFGDSESLVWKKATS